MVFCRSEYLPNHLNLSPSQYTHPSIVIYYHPRMPKTPTRILMSYPERKLKSRYLFHRGSRDGKEIFKRRSRVHLRLCSKHLERASKAHHCGARVSRSNELKLTHGCNRSIEANSQVPGGKSDSGIRPRDNAYLQNSMGYNPLSYVSDSWPILACYTGYLPPGLSNLGFLWMRSITLRTVRVRNRPGRHLHKVRRR